MECRTVGFVDTKKDWTSLEYVRESIRPKAIAGLTVHTSSVPAQYISVHTPEFCSRIFRRPGVDAST